MSQHELQIAANIVTRADNQQLLSDVGQAANQMARIIEDAMSGIGEKIAQAVIGGFKKGTQEIGQSGTPSGYGTSPGGIIAPRDAIPQQVSQQTAQQVVQQQQATAAQAPLPPMPSFQGGFSPVTAGLQALMTKDPSLQKFVTELTTQGQRSSTDIWGQTASADISTSQIAAYRAMQKTGIAPELTREDRAGYEQSAQTLTERLKDVSEELRILRESVNKNSETLKTAEGGERDRLKATIAHQTEEAKQKGMEATQLGQDISLNRQMATDGGMGLQGLIRRYGPAIGAAGGIAAAMGNLPSQFREGAVGSAEVGAIGGRALMRGDLDRAIALQMAGGQGRVEAQSLAESVLKITGNVGLAGAGIAASPFTAGMSLIPAAQFGVNAVGQAASFGAVQRGQSESILQRQMGERAELFSMGQSGRGFAMENFELARNMGDIGVANFLTSTGRDPRYARNAQERELAERTAVTGTSGERMSLMGMAAGWGLAPEQTRTLAAGVTRQAGIFNGRSRAEGTQEQMADLLALQAQGISAAPSVAMGMIRGGEQSQEGVKKALQESKDIISEMITSGMDRASINRTLEVMASQAASGLGQAGAARAEAETLATAAVRQFGEQPSEPQTEYTQRALGGLLQSSRGGGAGLGALAGFKTARDTTAMIRQMGVGADEGTELILREQPVTVDFIKELARKQGVKWTPERERAARKIQDETPRRELQNIEEVVGRVTSEKFMPYVMGKMTHTASALETLMLPDVVRGGATPGGVQGATPDVRRQAEEKLKGVAGAEEVIKGMTAVDAAKVAGGLNLLGENLVAINAGFTQLLGKMQSELKWSSPENQKVIQRDRKEQMRALPNMQGRR